MHEMARDEARHGKAFAGLLTLFLINTLFKSKAVK